MKYKLKNKYKGHSISTAGNVIILENVKSKQVKDLGLTEYFDLIKKTVSTKDK